MLEHLVELDLGPELLGRSQVRVDRLVVVRVGGGVGRVGAGSGMASVVSVAVLSNDDGAKDERRESDANGAADTTENTTRDGDGDFEAAARRTS
jgi:hypothetical protein